jgi:hypothetical protein
MNKSPQWQKWGPCMGPTAWTPTLQASLVTPLFEISKGDCYDLDLKCSPKGHVQRPWWHWKVAETLEVGPSWRKYSMPLKSIFWSCLLH